MIFEYKVRARHRLGWKEFKLYADTDIEEFFNRNSIDYVRNLTDTVENKQQEIERPNNIIKEVREKVNKYPEFNYSNDYMIFRNEIKEILDKENK